MPGVQYTRSLAWEKIEPHELVTTVAPEHPAFPHAMVLTVSFVLSPVIGYRMHTSLLQRRAETDSLWVPGLRRAVLCRWRLGWDDLAIVAWKKGGVVACGPGSTSGLLHSRACGKPSAGSPVHAFSAQ